MSNNKSGHSHNKITHTDLTNWNTKQTPLDILRVVTCYGWWRIVMTNQLFLRIYWDLPTMTKSRISLSHPIRQWSKGTKLLSRQLLMVENLSTMAYWITSHMCFDEAGHRLNRRRCPAWFQLQRRNSRSHLQLHSPENLSLSSLVRSFARRYARHLVLTSHF